MHSFAHPMFDKEQIIVHKLDYKAAHEINFNQEIIKRAYLQSHQFRFNVPFDVFFLTLRMLSIIASL